MLFQALWFLSVVSWHCAFSSVVIFQHCFWALCFFKCCGFLALFVGSVLFQAPWFFNVAFGHYAFSSTLVF
jgi:hypothetical protein